MLRSSLREAIVIGSSPSWARYVRPPPLGSSTVNVNGAAAARSPPAASRSCSSVRPYGRPPSSAVTSASAKAFRPSDRSSVPSTRYDVWPNECSRLAENPLNGPLRPLSSRTTRPASAASANRFVAVMTWPPSDVAVGPVTFQPALVRSSVFSCWARSGALAAASLSSVTVTVTVPEPSSSIFRATSVFTWHPDTRSTAALTTSSSQVRGGRRRRARTAPESYPAVVSVRWQARTRSGPPPERGPVDRVRRIVTRTGRPRPSPPAGARSPPPPGTRCAGTRRWPRDRPRRRR